MSEPLEVKEIPEHIFFAISLAQFVIGNYQRMHSGADPVLSMAVSEAADIAQRIEKFYYKELEQLHFNWVAQSPETRAFVKLKDGSVRIGSRKYINAHRLDIDWCYPPEVADATIEDKCPAPEL